VSAPLVRDLGFRPLPGVFEEMQAFTAERTAETRDEVWFVEHPPVYTLGMRADRSHLLAPGSIPVVQIDRGGQVTYHGPGQLVAYPIVLLGEGERDLHKYLRNLEQAVIETCVRFGIAADREPGKTGVWCTNAAGARKKLCSMGIACRKWIAFHGLALNVASDLSYFARINPCGFESSVMTTMAAELGERAPSMAETKHALTEELGRALSRDLSSER
jgi:lipoyl(octanoyl) transferase